MVGMEPRGPFCDAGAPVTDGAGLLLAIGANGASAEGGLITRFIDVRAIRATLQDRMGR